MNATTVGLSPKVVVAAIIQILAVVATFVEAGAFNTYSYIILASAVLTVVGGYLAGPGDVVPPVVPSGD